MWKYFYFNFFNWKCLHIMKVIIIIFVQ
jgi:hypothetical protein